MRDSQGRQIFLLLLMDGNVRKEDREAAVSPSSGFLLLFQRIAAVSMPQALRYFGRSVDGRLDLDGDDLVDVAVGAHGAAILLR